MGRRHAPQPLPPAVRHATASQPQQYSAIKEYQEATGHACHACPQSSGAAKAPSHAPSRAATPGTTMGASASHACGEHRSNQARTSMECSAPSEAVRLRCTAIGSARVHVCPASHDSVPALNAGAPNSAAMASSDTQPVVVASGTLCQADAGGGCSRQLTSTADAPMIDKLRKDATASACDAGASSDPIQIQVSDDHCLDASHRGTGGAIQ